MLGSFVIEHLQRAAEGGHRQVRHPPLPVVVYFVALQRLPAQLSHDRLILLALLALLHHTSMLVST